MKKLCLLFLTLYWITHTFSLHGMFVAVRRAGQAQSGRMAAQKISPLSGRVGQKRTFYTPESIKRFSELPKEIQMVSPVRGGGIAKKESGILEKMYAVKSDTPAIKLVQSLFHQVGNQFVPTRHISNPACALTSGILGLVIGAAEKNLLGNPQSRVYIINQWRNEYEKIATESKRSDGTIRSAKEISKLMNAINDKIDIELTIINDEYKNDKNNGRSILLSFFATKADLTSDHDMIHYLSGVNHFLPIIPNQSETPETAAPRSSETLFDRVKTFVQTLLSQKSYTAQDYAAFKANAQSIIKQSEKMEFALENFELALSTILNEKRGISSYPPKVVRSTFGYEGQHPRPNCVETAFQDLFNILLYNAQTQTFDLSLLPVGLQLNDKFKRFYENYKDINQINTPQVGQAFMNVVSNISGVDYYQKKNYELNARADNFLIVSNYLFGTSAKDLTELGNTFSDERRTITFKQHDPDQKGITKISMMIKNNQTNAELRADLGFSPGHGEISAPERESGGKTSLLDPNVLAKNYTISKEAQALFSIQPAKGSISKYGVSNIPASFYYAFDTHGDRPKVEIIDEILHNSVHDQEALDYALHLYKELDIEAAIAVFDKVVQSGVWHSQPKFKELLINLKDRIFNADNSEENNENRKKIARSILKHNVDDVELDAYNCFKQLFVASKHIEFEKALTRDPYTILTCAAEENFFSPILIDDLYNASDATYQKKFLADMLSAFAFYRETDTKANNIVFMAKKLIDQGANVNAVAKNPRVKPLIAAVTIGNNDLVELLLEHGAMINEESTLSFGNHKYNQVNVCQSTPLYVAIRKNNVPMAEFLLQHGANPNMDVSFDDGKKMKGIIWALSEPKMLELLLQHGANPNENCIGRIYIDLSPTPVRTYNTYLLNEAAGTRSPNIVDLLIRYGANINAIDEEGKTPLDHANDRTAATILKNAGAKTFYELQQEDAARHRQTIIE